MKKLLLVMVVLLIVGAANAANVDWVPAGPQDANLPGYDAAFWSVTTNWSTNGLPTTADVARISGVTAAVLDFTTSVNGLRPGYPNGEGELVIVKDGHLTSLAGGWQGPQGAKGTIEIQAGGSLTLGGHFWNGLYDDSDGSRLIMNGGDMTIGQAIDLGRDTNPLDAFYCAGYVELRTGTITALRYAQDDKSDWFTQAANANTGVPKSNMDIIFGTFHLTNPEGGDPAVGIADTQTLIDNGGLTAFGGDGTIVVNPVGDSITITATGDPLARTPTYDKWLPSGADIPGSWINLPSIPSGNPVWVEILHGGAPDNLASMGAPAAGKTTQALPNTPGVYYWQILTYQYGDPDDDIYNYGDDPNVDGAPVDQGPVMKYTSSNDLAPINFGFVTTPKVTWIDEPVTIQVIVDDDGQSLCVTAWSTNENDPNVTWSNPTYSSVPGGDYPGGVQVTMGIDIALNYHAAQFNVSASVSDFVNIDAVGGTQGGYDCARTACQATGVIGRFADYPADIGRILIDEDDGRDCMHGYPDLRRIGDDWLTGYVEAMPQLHP